MCKRAILTASNISDDTINDKIMTKLPGDSVNYLAINTVMNQGNVVNYHQEFQFENLHTKYI